jgi:hypothetical protein
MPSIAHRTSSLASLAVVVLGGLIASACSTAATSPSATRTSTAPIATSGASSTPAAASPSASATAASDAWLVVGTAGQDGLEVILASTREKDYDLPVGVPDATWGSLIVANPDGPDTRVQTLVVQPGFGGSSQSVPGAWRLPTIGADPIPAGVSADGHTIVLVPAVTLGAAASSSNTARESRFAIVDGTFDRAARVISLSGAFEYDAISPDGTTLYVVEHLPAPPVAHYQVRAVDLASGRLRDGVVVDKAALDEAMGGYPIAQVRSGDGMVFTLYRGAEHPFIHALNTIDGWALCIDLPARAADSDAAALDWGLAQTPDRRRLMAVNATLGIAADISIADLAVSRTMTFSPTAATRIALAKFGHQETGPAGRRVVVAPDGATVYAAGANGIVRLSSRDLGVVATLAAGTAIDALAVTPDGRTVYALTGTDGRIVQIDTASGVVIGAVPGAGYDRLVAIVPF